MNFGLAAEKARALGLDVEMVVVGDDIAIEGALRPRGLAGTLFVHKVAGHFARAGKSLAEVKAAAERVASSVVSIGVSLSSVSIPGQPFSQGRPRGNLDPTMALPGYAPSQGRPRSVAGGLSEQEIVAISRDDGLGPRK